MMTDVETKLEKAKFSNIDVQRHDSGDLSRVTVRVEEGTAMSGSGIEFRYAVKGEEKDRLKLSKVEDGSSTGNVLVSRLVWAAVFAENELPSRIPDVRSVESLAGKLEGVQDAYDAVHGEE